MEKKKKKVEHRFIRWLVDRFAPGFYLKKRPGKGRKRQKPTSEYRERPLIAPGANQGANLG